MRIFSSGKVAENLYVTGPAGIPVYLLDAPRPALFDAGMTVFSQGYINDIQEILGERVPAYLFLTHAHFDHVGAIGLFKQVWPELKIVASARCREILARPGALKLITALNENSIALAEKDNFTPIYTQPFKAVDVDIVAADNQEFDIGADLAVRALSAPGHTRDFMVYWIAAAKILIASEAAGCDDGKGGILPEFLVDIEAYYEGIARFAAFDVETLCTGHRLVLTAEDARSHLKHSPEGTRRYIAMVENFLTEENGDLDLTANRVKAAEWDLLPWPKQPEQAYMLNTRQRVLKIWEGMQARLK